MSKQKDGKALVMSHRDQAKNYVPTSYVIPCHAAMTAVTWEIQEAKELIRQAYNSLTNSTGLDDVRKPKYGESSLCQRMKKYLDTK